MGKKYLGSEEPSLDTSFWNNVTDSNFIQSHVDSFFPPVDPKEEVIDDKEDASGPVVNVISGKVEDADEAKEVLDLLLYSDEGLGQRVANYTELETPQTAGLAPGVIQLIPWTGFEMDETGDLPKEITSTDVIVETIIGGFTELVVSAVGTLKQGVLALAGFIADMGEIVVEWGLKLWKGIKDAFSAVKDAVNKVVEMMSALLDWIISYTNEMFSAVVQRVTVGLESWAEGIQTAMQEFFRELAKWDVVDGDESVDSTMEAGMAMMLSFVGMQDKAKELMDTLKSIMEFVGPFMEYISPFGVVGVIGNILGGDTSGTEGFFDGMKSLIGGAAENIIAGFIDIFIDMSLFLGFDDISIDTSGWETPSFQALSNFLSETGNLGGFLSIIVNGFTNADWSKVGEVFLTLVQSSLSVIAMYLVFATSQAFTKSSIISLISESIALVLSWVAGFKGDAVFTIISIFATEFFGLMGFLFGPEAIQALIIILEQIIAPFSLLTLG